MSYDERAVAWSPAWVALWVVNTAALVALAFVLSVGQWLTAVVLLFGVPEAIGLRRHHDALPPLTYVAARYVSAPVIFITVGFLVGAIGGFWFGVPHFLGLGALLALDHWAVDHFNVTEGR